MDEASAGGAAPAPTGPFARLLTGWPLLHLAVFCLLALGIYQGALRGDFMSDDVVVILDNPLVNDPSADNVRRMFDPSASSETIAGGNYAPVWLLLTAAERRVFGDGVLGYHVVNVLVHGVNALLLSALLLASGLPSAAALLGGLLFLVHPANVEAVAWIFQLKTVVSLGLSLGALLALRRRPGLATLLFALALLTKASASFALPMAAAMVYAWHGATTSRHWRWLAAWTAILIAYAIPEFTAFALYGEADVDAYEDAWVQVRTIAAIGARYLLMAPTAYGVSAFQQPPAALSWLDPWWLAALPLAALLAARTFSSLRRRSEEAAWWIGAAAAFVPVSQLFPFKYPMADRYLYFILPGLIGGGAFAAWELGGRLAAGARARRRAAAAVAAAGVALSIFFGVRSVARARLWRSPTLVYLDAATHYPDGIPAQMLRARRAAQVGDAAAAVAALRAAGAQGQLDFMALASDPGFGAIQGSQEFQSFILDLAGRYIEERRGREAQSQEDLHLTAHAHLLRGEYSEAILAFEAAILADGPQRELMRQELAQLRAAVPGASP